MAQTVLGIFTNRADADNAVGELERGGFNPKDLSVITKEVVENEEVVTGTAGNVAEGAVGGVTTGGVIGGLAGLLVGVGALTIPGVGAILIGGPLAAALGLTGAAATAVSGAVTGAVAGGLVGALVGLGLPEETAKIYEERVREGGVVLAVYCRLEEQDRVRSILQAHNATQIDEVAS